MIASGGVRRPVFFAAPPPAGAPREVVPLSSLLLRAERGAESSRSPLRDRLRERLAPELLADDDDEEDDADEEDLDPGDLDLLLLPSFGLRCGGIGDGARSAYECGWGCGCGCG